MHPKGKGKISYTLQAISIIPLLFFGLLIMLLSSHWVSNAMYAEVKEELSNVAVSVHTMFDAAYPGDYDLVGDTAYQLYKGDYDLTSDYSLIDEIKSRTGLEITLFYEDTRILTTICNSDGERIVGSGAPDVVIKDVLTAGQPKFYNNSIIYGSSYFAYYMPLTNTDGSVVGMLFVGKPSENVDKAIQRCVYPLMFATVIAALSIALFTSLYTRSFVSSLLNIHTFLSDVSTGDLSAKLNASVLRRNDELGEIGYSAINMQRSLFAMIEQDSLTELFNRRSGDRKLRQAIQKGISQNIPYCLAIGDIDFFKKVNDTYGHECGDLVLKNVAAKLRQHMYTKGFAARWGGEEFLLVFDHMTAEEAYHELSALLDDIRAMESDFDGQTINVTMTFGLAEGDTDNITMLLRNADTKLYEGKTNGRNRVVL